MPKNPIDVKLEDPRKLMRRLTKQLGPKLAKKVLRKGVNASATPVLKAARRNAPVGEGTLKKSLSKRTRSYPAAVATIVGPKSKAAPHAHLIEFGTAHSRARPFLRRAIDENEQAVRAVLVKKLREGLDREAKKLRGQK